MSEALNFLGKVYLSSSGFSLSMSLPLSFMYPITTCRLALLLLSLKLYTEPGRHGSRCEAGKSELGLSL